MTLVKPRRQSLLVAIMLGLLALTGLWSINSMLRQRDGATVAAAELAACRQLAASIEALRARPAVASAQALGTEQLGERIDAASRLAALPDSQLQGVLPQFPRRIGDSPYVQMPTTLELRSVSLAQLAPFLFHLTDHTGLNVSDLQLQTPRNQVPAVSAAGELWDVQATLTYLIYEPLKTNRQPD